MRTQRQQPRPMSNLDFSLMEVTFSILDFFYRYIDKRIAAWGITPGMTLVDYGCGPGRYTTRFARLVGDSGKVYAVDIQELAIQAVQRKMRKQGLRNIEPVLAVGHHSAVPDGVADVTCAIDMFFSVADPDPFLAELKRITKQDGLLIIDDGHQTRATTKQKLAAGGHWLIVEETRDHLKCRPGGR